MALLEMDGNRCSIPVRTTFVEDTLAGMVFGGHDAAILLTCWSRLDAHVQSRSTYMEDLVNGEQD